MREHHLWELVSVHHFCRGVWGEIVGGVYIVFDEDEVIYVGKSEDVWPRLWYGHLGGWHRFGNSELGRYLWRRALDWRRILILVLSWRAFRCRVGAETELIRRLQPLCNVAGKKPPTTKRGV